MTLKPRGRSDGVITIYDFPILTTEYVISDRARVLMVSLTLLVWFRSE